MARFHYLDWRFLVELPRNVVLRSASRKGNHKKVWFRDLDSNQDTQLQRLMSYRLDDPGTVASSLTEARNSAQGGPSANARIRGFC